MFPYTVKYTESEHDIQNSNLLYKIHRKHQNAFDILEYFGKMTTGKIFYSSYNFHNSYFVMLVSFVVWVFWDS